MTLHALRKPIRFLAFTAAALSVAAGASTQAAQGQRSAPPPAGATQVHTTEATSAKVTSSEVKGEVAYLQGDYLIAKMIPGGDYRLFHLQPGKVATIDGNRMPLNKVKVGTVLTAHVSTMERAMIDRTVTTLTGTVWYASAKTVILTMANGEQHQYEVPPGLKFNVDGQMKEAGDLRQGMKVTATKIVESPRTEITESNVVTGVAPR